MKELIASDMTVDKVYNVLKAILPGGEKRQKMLDDYEEMRHIIGPAGASRRAAEIMVKLLNKN